MPEGGTISGRWAMTDIAPGGLRRDRSFDFAAAAGETAGTSFFDGRLLTADDLRDEQMADHDVVVDGMIAALEDWQAMMPASGGDLVG